MDSIISGLWVLGASTSRGIKRQQLYLIFIGVGVGRKRNNVAILSDFKPLSHRASLGAVPSAQRGTVVWQLTHIFQGNEMLRLHTFL